MGEFSKQLDSYFGQKSVLVDLAEGKPPVRFYAVSPGLLLQLRGMARPITQALAVLFADKDRDGGRVLRSFRDPKTGEEGTETVLEAVSVQMATFRSQEREQAIDRLIDAVADDNTRIALARLIMDSMRDEWERPVANEAVKAFADNPALTLQAWGAMLKGVAKANAGILGPLGGKLVEKATKLAEGLGAERSGASTAEGKASASPTSGSAAPPNPAVS